MDSAPAKASPAHTSEPQLPTPKPASSLAGTKRSASSLLPAFEPLSSSPGLPRPTKRQNVGSSRAHLKYPTPVPTSSTGILSSSPLRVRPNALQGLSERSPLSAVPSVELSEKGETLIMGRSSNSSHFQLSTNKLISRVHVKARYIPGSSSLETNKIEIVCHGWNGLKLHCQGRSWELFKGDSFTSETEGTEIMVDVQDARVMLQWPHRAPVADGDALSDSSWDASPPRSQSRAANLLASMSPIRRPARISSPETPTPAHTSSQRLQSLLPPQDGDSGIEIYEDEPEDEDLHGDAVNVNASIVTDATASFSSDLSDLDEENYPDEENDPIIHSFGPFGADITARMASIITKPSKTGKMAGRPEPITLATLPEDDVSGPASPTDEVKSAIKANAAAAEAETASEEGTPVPSVEFEIDAAVTNHVINQLAYSRLSSTPLSTIMLNLPAEQKKDLPREALRRAVESMQCVGIIERQGKDAAGKVLESEYYYVPDNDNDEQRRAAVVDGLRKPSLRACRKQHKQYYWKRPRTP